MQFKRNLKHILILSVITFFSLFGVIRLFGATFSLPITHFFIYRENVPLLNWIYKYNFHPSKDITIVHVDDATINKVQAQSDLKTLTINKSLYIDLIEKLESVKVKGIAFDIVFQNKDPDEEKLASTLSRYPNVVIATTSTVKKLSCHSSKDGIYTDTQGGACKKNKDGRYESENWSCTKDQDGKFETCDGAPRSVYRDANWGNIDQNNAGDRKYASINIKNKNLPYASWKNTQEIDTLSLALYKTSIGVTPVPFVPEESILIPFFGGGGTYPSVSFGDTMDMKKVDLIANFAGKYVFVGESGEFIHDAYISPVTGELMDGVESHAHFLDGILQGRYLKGYDMLNLPFVACIFILMIMMITIYMVASKYVSLIIATILTLWLIWMSRYAYFSHAIVLEMLPLLLAGSIFSFPITFIYRFFIVDREKRMLTSAFAHYVDPTLVSQISANAHAIALGGESRELSVLFSDIAGFTTLSEKTPVRDLFFLMSSYLSHMTDILTAEGGTLDKYIGDAIMGFFGAPISEADHAIRACRTALEMRNALPHFNKELLARSMDSIDFRVGIGTGEVLVGNIGSHDRFNYTVLGDTVNLASRLEATSKEYGTHIIVSERTYELAKEQFRFRKLDRITVKGKNVSSAIYELIAKIDDKTIDSGVFDRYEQALEVYFHGDYLSAGKLWETQIDIDPPSRVMAHRCLEILKGDIIVEGGVFHMLKK